MGNVSLTQYLVNVYSKKNKGVDFYKKRISKLANHCERVVQCDGFYIDDIFIK